jgi:pimeloyl-ACP methyl ester carboxylesterase
MTLLLVVLVVVVVLVAAAIVVPRLIMRRDDQRATTTELSGPALTLESRSVTTGDGAVLHVVEQGAGQPLVLIHGLSLSYDLWRYQLLDLADRFRVIAYDLRGHDLSTVGTDGIGPHASAADLAAVLEQLDLRGAVVAGHSIGGTVLGQFCADHADVATERVAGLVFVDTFASAIAGEGRLREIFSPFFARLTAASAKRRKGDPSGDVKPMMYVAARSPFGPGPDAEQVRFTVQMGRSTEPKVASEATVANLDYDVRSQLGALQIPSLVIRGSKDRLSTARSTEQLREALADPTVEIIDGVGHLPMLEARKQFDDLLTAFADRVKT